ncbi:Pore membrane protein of 33 kDa [Nakaseomyces bracarensis]|uniref:Pore membrane protein of 33 kDa n=1 Tax=Nakaseomyces bracarensis TaxID=273131 RepID=A0ABR4NTG0_9SACH
MSSTTKPPVQPQGYVTDRFMRLAKTLQFSWFAGHFIVVLSSLLYLFKFSETLYRFAYVGVLASFGIITYQQGLHQKVSLALLTNENILYFALALLWFFTPRFSMSLVPYLMFSVFHVLVYMKTTLLPQVFNQTLEQKSKAVVFIDRFVLDYNERCMYWVSTTELIILVLLIIRALCFLTRSWIVLVFYILFIKIKYETSKYMKAAFSQWRVRMDGVISHPGVPPQVKAIYNQFKTQLINLSKVTITTPPQEKKEN